MGSQRVGHALATEQQLYIVAVLQYVTIEMTNLGVWIEKQPVKGL